MPNKKANTKNQQPEYVSSPLLSFPRRHVL